MSITPRARSQDTLATGYMLAGILFASFIPAFLDLSGAAQTPFLFNTGWKCGAAIGGLIVISAFFRPLLFNKTTFSVIARAAISWSIFGATVGAFDYTLFAWSIRFIDISVATILLETWPIGIIILTSWLLSSENKYQNNFRRVFPLIGIAFVGFIFATASSTGGFRQITDVSSFNIIAGVGLALLAALASTFAAFTYSWGRDLSDKLQTEEPTIVVDTDRNQLLFFGAILGFTISSFLAALIQTGIGLTVGNETLDLRMLATIIPGGLLFHATANILVRKATLTTSNLGITALAYAIPIFALFWIAVVSQIQVARMDYLIIGATAIIVANLLINFEAEIRFGFKALLLALGTCGALVYLRDDIFGESTSIWHWPGNGYFEVIGVSATVFTLLLAFRVARLVSRSNDETVRIFGVYRKLESLVRLGVLQSGVLKYIRDIDNAKDLSKLREAYTRARHCIAKAAPQDNASRETQNQVEADLDVLIRSKQTGLVLGEVFAIFIFGGITIVLALLTVPHGLGEGGGWVRLWIDLFAMLISAVIVFLIAYVFDMDHERDEPKLEQNVEGRGYFARFPDRGRRLFDQTLSIIVGIAIVATYGVLLSHKWLGWLS